MDRFLDIFFTFFHLAIVVFNLFGWIPKRTRKAHLLSVLLTAAAWFLLGIWFGIGYCPLTDWHWKVKEQRGERNIPPNFIEYVAEKLTGQDFNSGFITLIIAICFALAVLLTLYVNFILPRCKKHLSTTKN